MKTIHVSTVLDAPAELVWSEVQTRRLLDEVLAPVVRIAPVRGGILPGRWTHGATARCRLYLFGFIPLGVHTLEFLRVDGARREIQTHESDALVARWDHLVRVEPAGSQCRYSDEVVIDAGRLTPVVALFANLLYRHRQRRWRRIAKRLVAERAMPAIG
jgi:hypothetical protein